MILEKHEELGNKENVLIRSSEIWKKKLIISPAAKNGDEHLENANNGENNSSPRKSKLLPYKTIGVATINSKYENEGNFICAVS